MTTPDENTIFCTPHDLAQLPEYTNTVPPGNIIGIRWKTDANIDRLLGHAPDWWLGEYVEGPHGPSNLPDIRWQHIVVVRQSNTKLLLLRTLRTNNMERFNGERFARLICEAVDSVNNANYGAAYPLKLAIEANLRALNYLVDVRVFNPTVIATPTDLDLTNITEASAWLTLTTLRYHVSMDWQNHHVCYKYLLRVTAQRFRLRAHCTFSQAVPLPLRSIKQAL